MCDIALAFIFYSTVRGHVYVWSRLKPQSLLHFREKVRFIPRRLAAPLPPPFLPIDFCLPGFLVKEA